MWRALREALIGAVAAAFVLCLILGPFALGVIVGRAPH